VAGLKLAQEQRFRPTKARGDAAARERKYRQWIAFEQYVRFEAPPAVSDRRGHTTEVRPSPVFRDLSWFDLAKARDVVSAGGGSGEPQVWVDQERGVFYFRLTD
jgi:hypothetical protein